MQNDFQSVNASILKSLEEEAKASSDQYTEIEGELPSRLAMRAYQWARQYGFSKIDFGDSPHLAYYCLMGQILGLEGEGCDYRWRQTLTVAVESLLNCREGYNQQLRENLERDWLVGQVERLLPLAKKAFRKSRVPSLSVIVAHRNRTHFVDELLESFAEQNDVDFELIIADDASSSETVEKLKAMEKRKYPFRFKIAYSQPHLGARGIRNFGVRQAQGDIVVFFDDDNLPLKNSISLLRQAWRSSPFDILVAPFWRVFDRTEAHRLFHGSPRRGERFWLPLGGGSEIARVQNVLGDMNLSLSRETFLRTGGLNERSCLTCEDWEFLSTATQLNLSIGVLPQPTQIYFDQAGSFFKRLPRTLSEVAAVSGMLSPEQIHCVERFKSAIAYEIGDSFRAQTLFSGQVPSQKGPHRLRLSAVSEDGRSCGRDGGRAGGRTVQVKMSSGAKAEVELTRISATGTRAQNIFEVIKGEGVYKITGNDAVAEIELNFPRGLFSVEWIVTC